MAGYISGDHKLDIAVAGASSGYTTPYYDMGKYAKAIFICEAGSMSASGSITLSALQAVSSTGSGSAVIGIYTTMGSTTALACDINSAVAVTLTNASSWLTAQTIIVNGVTFTADKTATTGTFAATRLFQSSSDGGKTTQCLDHLAAFINHGTYGCTGLLALANATYMTIEANPPGSKLVTVQVASSTNMAVWGTRYIGTLEVLADQLSNASSMRYVAVTNTLGAGETVRQHCVVIRTGARYSPDSTALLSAYERGV